jgi:hypothetical protein
MASEGDALAVAVAEPLSVAALPLALLLEVLSRLPVDCRLRCAEVCRAWRAALNERSLWTRLDLTAASGVHVPAVDDEDRAYFLPLAPAVPPGFAAPGFDDDDAIDDDAIDDDAIERTTLDGLLRCAAARAGGGLVLLHLDSLTVTHAALLEVAAANAGALREVRVGRTNQPTSEHSQEGFTVGETDALLGAAPLLRTLATDLHCTHTDVQTARRALRNEAPYGPLRVGHLKADLGEEDDAGVVAFAADAAVHASLIGLALNHARLDAATSLDAVVNAALARQLHSVRLFACGYRGSVAPALARLLSSGALDTLECTYLNLHAADPDVLAAALRANSTLTSLTLIEAGVWQNITAGIALLAALTGHTSLRALSLHTNSVEPADTVAAGAALGALVAADAPALTDLDVAWSGLGDDGLRALFEALPHNTHLRTLACYGSDLTAAFARDVLLPAVRANTSLRCLTVSEEVDSGISYRPEEEPTQACLRELEALVAQRSSTD